jgi:hypothetical protein
MVKKIILKRLLMIFSRKEIFLDIPIKQNGISLGLIETTHFKNV